MFCPARSLFDKPDSLLGNDSDKLNCAQVEIQSFVPEAAGMTNAALSAHNVALIYMCFSACPTSEYHLNITVLTLQWLW